MNRNSAALLRAFFIVLILKCGDLFMAARAVSLRTAFASAASIIILACAGTDAIAQQNTSVAPSTELPPVVVPAPNAPKASRADRPSRQSATLGAARHTRRGTRTASAPSQPPAPTAQSGQVGQDPRGPINGYVAERSLTGTKTNTPIMET